MAEEQTKLSITKIWAANFKSLRDFEMDLVPFTVLVGRNGSGKSNIIDVLRFISEAFYDGVPNAVTYRNGPRSILHVSEDGQAKQFSVGLRATGGSLAAEYQLTVRSMTHDRISVPEEKISLRIGDQETRIVVKNGVFKEPRLSSPIRGVVSRLSTGGSASAVVTPMLSLIGDQSSFAATAAAWLFSEKSPDEIVDIAAAISNLSTLLGEMRFYRIFPDAIREHQPISLRDSLEEDGSNFAGVLGSLKSGYAPSYDRVLKALQRVAPNVVDINPRTYGGNRFVHLVHGDPSIPGSRWSLDIAQESDGIARTLALLVAIEQKPPPALLAIEEPELGIHTGALSVIEDLLEGVSSESQVLISTHSSDLLDFVPIDAIRAVVSSKGASQASTISEHQKNIVLDDLMTPGYVHRGEGFNLDETAFRQREAE